MKKAFSSSIYVMSLADGSVLLIKHKQHNIWIPPGGHGKPNETPLETALRELEEETRITPDTGLRIPRISGQSVSGFLAYEEHDTKVSYFMNHVFLGTVPHSTQIRGEDEYSAFAWMSDASGDNVPADVASKMQRIDRAWKRGAFKPDFVASNGGCVGV